MFLKFYDANTVTFLIWVFLGGMGGGGGEVFLFFMYFYFNLLQLEFLFMTVFRCLHVTLPCHELTIFYHLGQRENASMYSLVNIHTAD